MEWLFINRLMFRLTSLSFLSRIMLSAVCRLLIGEQLEFISDSFIQLSLSLKKNPRVRGDIDCESLNSQNMGAVLGLAGFVCMANYIKDRPTDKHLTGEQL